MTEQLKIKINDKEYAAEAGRYHTRCRPAGTI